MALSHLIWKISNIFMHQLPDKKIIKSHFPWLWTWLICWDHLLNSHMQIHAEHNDTMKNIARQWRRVTQFLEKYTSHFIWKVCVWEGVRDRTELQYINPHSYGHQRCVFLILQGCSTGDPGGPHCWVRPFSTTFCL